MSHFWDFVLQTDKWMDQWTNKQADEQSQIHQILLLVQVFKKNANYLREESKYFFQI